MADWYISRAGQQQGPLAEPAVGQLIARGELASTDMVWSEGMAEWLPAQSVPALAALFPAAAGPAMSIGYSRPFSDGTPPVLTPHAMDMLRKTAPWVRLFGVLIFIFCGMILIGGVLSLIGSLAGFAGTNNGGPALGVMMLFFSAFYIGIGALYFFPGLYLNRYAARINMLVRSGREDALEQALEAQKSFWKFLGIVFLISIGLWVVMMIVVMSGAFFAASRVNTPMPAPVPVSPSVP